MIRSGIRNWCVMLGALLLSLHAYGQSGQSGQSEKPAELALKPFYIATFKYVENIEWRSMPHTLFFKELMARHGFEARMVFLPGKRALRNVEIGLIDAELGRAKGTTDISPQLFESNFPFTSICLRRVYRAGDIMPQADSIGFQIGAQSIEAMMKRRWPGAQTVPYLSFKQAAKMLASTRVDMLLLPHVGEAYIQNLGLTDFDIQPLFELPLHFIVGERYRHMLPEFEKTAEQLIPKYPGVRCQ